MSWDVSIVKFSRTYHNVADIPDNERPLGLDNGWQGIDCSSGEFVE